MAFSLSHLSNVAGCADLRLSSSKRSRAGRVADLMRHPPARIRAHDLLHNP
jgi:hypothetical protein